LPRGRPDGGTLIEDYRALLERLDEWFSSGRRDAPIPVPCQGGCTACCHGPFDISIADAELVRDAVRRLPSIERAAVADRARALLDRMRAAEPAWEPPYEVAAIGEDRFDRLSDALADEPCPLLDEDGRCRIYADRPLVCRLIGLSMVTPAGRLIENACPIQDRFPGYAELPPVPFELDGFEEREMECLRAAAQHRFGDPERWGFETTIAAEIAAETQSRRGEHPTV
jgi:Fe-S-cluster containining protein